MPKYFVIESICEISRINQSDDIEWIATQKANDGSYMVESKKFHITRYLTTYNRDKDAKVSFEKRKKELNESQPCYEKFNLWEVSALTERGAAKKALKKSGSLIKTEQLDMGALKNKKKEEIIGQLMLTELETGASNEELSEIRNIFGR